LARRAGFVDSLREVYGDVLLVDLGDFFGNRVPATEKSHSEIVVDYMRIARYDVATIGEMELNYGLPFLKEELHNGKFDVVSANFFDAQDSTLLFDPYVVKKVDGIRVGFLGLMDDDPRRVGVFEQLEKAYVTSYVEAARKYLPELKEKSDIVVALAHVGLGNARKLAEEVPGFDVVLVGHGGDRTPIAEKVGETILVKAGSKSSSVGTLLLSLSDANRIVAFDGESRTLKKYGRKNDQVDSIVSTCQDREKARDKMLSKRQYRMPAIPQRPEVLAADGYLGWETCQVCHPKIYERWSESPHARAFAILAEGDKWNDPKCLPCHVTGYESAAQQDSTDVKPELWNVQCEACHGMGTKHRRDGTMRSVPESVCLRCHTPEWSPNWNYKEALKKIDHGKDEGLD
jgi:hypothetical protein